MPHPPPPQEKKLKLKNCFLILLSPIFWFFNFNFLWEHFVTKVSLHFLNQHQIFNFFYTQYDLFHGKKFHYSEGRFLKFSDTRTKKRKMPFLDSLVYLLLIQNYMKQSNFQKFCQNHWTLMYNSWYCLGGSVVHASPGKKNSALLVFPSHKIIVKSSSTFFMKVWLVGENPARPIHMYRANRPHSSPPLTFLHGCYEGTTLYTESRGRIPWRTVSLPLAVEFWYGKLKKWRHGYMDSWRHGYVETHPGAM